MKRIPPMTSYRSTRRSLPHLLSSPQQAIYAENEGDAIFQLIENKYATSSPITERYSKNTYVPYNPSRRGTSHEKFRKSTFGSFPIAETTAAEKEFEMEKYCGYFHPVAIITPEQKKFQRTKEKAIRGLSTKLTSPEPEKIKGNVKVEWGIKTLKCEGHGFPASDPKWKINRARTKCLVNYRIGKGKNKGEESNSDEEGRERIQDTRTKMLERRNHKTLGLNKEAFDFYKNILKGSIRRVKSYIKFPLP